MLNFKMIDSVVGEPKDIKQKPGNGGVQLPEFLKDLPVNEPRVFNNLLTSLQEHRPGVTPTGFSQYLAHVAEGFNYAIDTYGESCMPRGVL